MRSTSSNGYRWHCLVDTKCWCNPHIEHYLCTDCGHMHVILVHRDVALRYDSRPRMAVFSR